MQSVAPPRAASSTGGSLLTASWPDALCQEREDAIVRALIGGNIPAFMREFVEVDCSGKDATGNERKLKIYVMPDYLCVGSGGEGEIEDFVRVPLNPLSAQTVADEFGCTLPTKKMVDLIWKAAEVKLTPQAIPPDAKMTTTARFVQHNALVEKSRSLQVLGKLVAGHQKDVVITNRLIDAAGKFLRKVAIYGWQYLTGKVIQDLNPTSHEDTYADYSHGIRLIALECELEGSLFNVHDLLADPVLSVLLSDEGPMRFLSYPKRIFCTKCDRSYLSTDGHTQKQCDTNVVHDVNSR